MEDHAKFITDMGGPKKIADIIKKSYGKEILPQGVSLWRHRGVPHKYRYFLSQEAKKKGVKIPKNFLSEHA